MSERESAAEGQSSLAIGVGIGGLALVIAVAFGLALYLRRAVVRPVVSVARATGRLAAGELATRVPASREDEIGDLARGFNSMADSLERGQAELKRSNAELTRSNAELEQFASVTSHDLQAPLTTISMYAELLQRRQAAGADGSDLIDGIRGATQQARTLIRDLLKYSRAGRGDLDAEPVASELVVDQALEALAGAIEATGAHVRVGSLPVVLADRSNLCRVFTNLVGNAVKFTRGDEPEVSVEAEADGAMWRFDIRDNGIGMDPLNASRIFEPFRRLHGEDDYEGTGIGLAVCERIVEQHGGHIWVSSVPGEGSVFSFTLPGAELPGDAPDLRRNRPPRGGGDRAPPDRLRPAFVVALALAACGGDDKPAKTVAEPAPLRIGTKNFTESDIVGQLYKQALDAKGVPAELQSMVGTTEVINLALRDGSLDMYPEYVGVLLSEVDKIEQRPATAAAAYGWRSGPRSGGASRCSSRTPLPTTRTRSPSRARSRVVRACAASATSRASDPKRRSARPRSSTTASRGCSVCARATGCASSR